MESLDLDLNNYGLNDILKLFNLDYDFNKEGLKQAKKVVLMASFHGVFYIQQYQWCLQ